VLQSYGMFYKKDGYEGVNFGLIFFHSK
jgi:hypothetical protein